MLLEAISASVSTSTSREEQHSIAQENKTWSPHYIHTASTVHLHAFLKIGIELAKLGGNYRYQTEEANSGSRTTRASQSDVPNALATGTQLTKVTETTTLTTIDESSWEIGVRAREHVRIAQQGSDFSRIDLRRFS